MSLFSVGIRRAVIALALLAPLAAPLAAQGVAPGGAPPNRQRLEETIRQRLGQVVRQRLALDDRQMARLQETNQKYERRRVDLVVQEREARAGLRAELQAGAQADQKRVDQLLTQLLAVQRQRLDLLEQEQKDLAAFLTPVQRAKYLALQEQVRRRVEELRGNQAQRRRARLRGGVLDDAGTP